MDQASDHQVVSAVLAGDVEAYGALVQRYQKPIYNLMFRLTGSYADSLDLAQETFIKAYEALHRFRKGSRFFPWLYSIGLNHGRNFLRRNKIVQVVDLDDWEESSGLDHPGQEEDNLCARLDAHDLTKALTRIPVDYREAVVLRYHEELSMEEIASILKVSVSGAKMRVHRGLRKLREILEKGYHEEG
ncbi:MAG TPA: RNA polymerase [Syntrophobacteraceae bacterium]|nr:RNA polymerase [Syntrophobacteraceae bacterium]